MDNTLKKKTVYRGKIKDSVFCEEYQKILDAARAMHEATDSNEQIGCYSRIFDDQVPREFIDHVDAEMDKKHTCALCGTIFTRGTSAGQLQCSYAVKLEGPRLQHVVVGPADVVKSRSYYSANRPLRWEPCDHVAGLDELTGLIPYDVPISYIIANVHKAPLPECVSQISYIIMNSGLLHYSSYVRVMPARCTSSV